MNLYKKTFKELEKAKINYLIVGGVAVNLYGYTRFTGDVDILLALNPSNLSKMDKLMHNLDYVERIPVNIKELGNKIKLNEFIKKKGLKAYTYISNSQPQLDIDVIVEQSIDFKDYDKGKTIIKVWNMELPVVSIDDLIKMKKSAKRDKDMLDIEALLKLKEL
jgi:predicted nucleotidyltransferase